MANIFRHVQFVRNSTLFETRELAIAGLRTQGESVDSTLKDGELILGRYKETTGDSYIVRVIIGAVYVDGSTRRVDIIPDELVNSLNANITSDSVDGLTVQVVEEKGIITSVVVNIDNPVVTYTAGSDTQDATITVTSADETKLLQGSAISKISDFTNKRIEQEINKLDVSNVEITKIETLTKSEHETSDGKKVTFNGVAETDGKIGTGTAYAQTLELKGVAFTGNANDVVVTYHTTGTEQGEEVQQTKNVQEVVDLVDNRLHALESLPKFNTVVCSSADNTPSGITWGADPVITGTLVASENTLHIIYLVPNSTNGNDIYAEYITVKTSESTYTWEKVGNTATDLQGYIKTITVNGKEYSVSGNVHNITLNNVVTSVTGEELITDGGNSDFVKVKASRTRPEPADGTETITLSSNVKIQSVANADNINQGLAEASDVKTYVDGQITALDSNITSDDASVATVRVVETDGKITDVVVTTIPANVTGTATELNATTETGAVTGADIAKIKTYVDAKAAASTTTVSSTASDGIKVTETTTDTHKNYDITLELADKSVLANSTTPSTLASNLLKIDSDGKLSIEDTWDCGTF